MPTESMVATVTPRSTPAATSRASSRFSAVGYLGPVINDTGTPPILSGVALGRLDALHANEDMTRSLVELLPDELLNVLHLQSCDACTKRLGLFLGNLGEEVLLALDLDGHDLHIAVGEQVRNLGLRGPRHEPAQAVLQLGPQRPFLQARVLPTGFGPGVRFLVEVALFELPSGTQTARPE